MKNKLYWQDTADPYPESECISVPIYYNADRDKTVTCFNMPCGGNQSRWTQCGAALFLKSQWRILAAEAFRYFSNVTFLFVSVLYL